MTKLQQKRQQQPKKGQIMSVKSLAKVHNRFLPEEEVEEEDEKMVAGMLEDDSPAGPDALPDAPPTIPLPPHSMPTVLVL